MATKFLHRPAAAAVAAVLATAVVSAQPVFTRVADSSTAIPNGGGAFNTFFQPTVSGTTVAFHGYRAVSGLGVPDEGVYSWTVAAGTLAIVADKSTPVPGGTGNFLNFGYGGGVRVDAVVSGTGVAFGGTGATTNGVYTATTSGGSLTRVADTTTMFPGGSGPQPYFYSDPMVSGSTVVFFGQHTNGLPTLGIYSAPAAGGAITKVADNGSAIPNGTGTFTDIAFATVSGTNVAFYGSRLGNNQEGIYAGTTTGGALTRVADRNTPIPNGTGTFAGFGTTPAISGTLVAFQGQSSAGQHGIYTGTTGGGPLTRIADTSTHIPGGVGNFGDFNPNPGVSGSLVAFLGTGSGTQLGIYYEDTSGGAVAKLIAVGDPLDGRTVSGLQFGRGGLDATAFTFEADFTNGTSGVYYAQITPVPEPGILFGPAAVTLGLIALASRRSAQFARLPGSFIPSVVRRGCNQDQPRR
jgi:hypothetical protein